MESIATPATLHRHAPQRATIKDWLAIPEEKRAELIDGIIVYQGMPGPRHGRTQTRTAALVVGPFDRRPGEGERPGGWWISQEVDMELAGMGCRPDILGWRRADYPRLPEPDERGLVTAVPNWVCEVLSRSTVYTDKAKKRVGYHRAGVQHYWLVDPEDRILTVLERTDRDYLIVLVAGPEDVVRAAPFDAVEIPVAEMFGDEEGSEIAPSSPA